MPSGADSSLNDMVDAWEFELDHREAIVSFREERVLQLEQRLLELQEIERVYRQQSTATKPSKPRRVRKKKERTEAQEKTLDAIRALHSAEDAVGGEALGEACRLLEASCIKSAASAYMVVAGVAESCEEDGCITELVKTAVRAVRDALVTRCCSQAVAGDRRSFLETAEQAFGRRLHRELRAVLLMSYHKTSKNASNTFPSNSQLDTMHRGHPRPPRKGRTGGHAPSGLAFEGSDGHAAETTGLVRPTVRPWCFSASKRAVASAAVSKRGASQPALGASTSLGASRTLEDAAVVQRAQEFRQARDGEWYTIKDFMQYYGSGTWAGWYYWERALRKAVPPAVAHSGSSEEARRTAGDAVLECRDGYEAGSGGQPLVSWFTRAASGA